MSESRYVRGKNMHHRLVHVSALVQSWGGSGVENLRDSPLSGVSHMRIRAVREGTIPYFGRTMRSQCLAIRTKSWSAVRSG